MSERYSPPAAAEGHESEAPESESPELEIEGQGGDEGGGDGEGEEPNPGDWERQAHDKTGLAAKERSRRRAAERTLGELQGRLANLEARLESGGRDELVDLITGLRGADNEPITDIQQIKRALKTFLARDQEDTRQQGQRAQHANRVNSISSN